MSIFNTIRYFIVERSETIEGEEHRALELEKLFESHQEAEEYIKGLPTQSSYYDSDFDQDVIVLLSYIVVKVNI